MPNNPDKMGRKAIYSDEERKSRQRDRDAEYRNRPENKERHKERARQWYYDNKALVLSRRYEKVYGVTEEFKRLLIADQDNKCAICLDPLPYEKAHLDHNHATGKVRGCLCRGCNHLISNARECEPILLMAIQYLEEHNGRG